jgi:hypothetical protein
MRPPLRPQLIIKMGQTRTQHPKHADIEAQFGAADLSESRIYHR